MNPLTTTAAVNSSSTMMTSKVFLSDDDASNTKCSKCQNYLSIPPVIIHQNNIVCGRCVQEHKLPQSNRAHFYENTAKFLFFPCKNDIYGCSVKIPWGKSLDHEANCLYKQTICPEINCDCKILIDRIVQHFEAKHNHLILKQNHFELPQSNDNIFINKLFLWKNEIFLIQLKTGDGDIFFRISNTKGTSKKIILHLNGELSSGSICLNQFRVMEYNLKFPKFSDSEKLNINTLTHVLGSKIECTITFDDQNKPRSRNTNDEKLFSEMECPICLAYMKPPISMCSTGHSLCGECKAKLTRCPSCNSSFSNTRNYALEKIAEIITYPCKYKKEGCNFVGNINNIMAHESTCSIAHECEVNCFASQGCTWRGSYAKAFQHISSTHSDLCLQLGNLVSINISNYKYDFSKTYFFLYDGKIFKLTVTWGSPHNTVGINIDWAIMCISNERTVKEYLPYLEIVKDNRIIIINGSCEKVDPQTLIFNLPNHIPISPTYGLVQQNTIYLTTAFNRSNQKVNPKAMAYNPPITFPRTLLNDFMQENSITFKLYMCSHD